MPDTGGLRTMISDSMTIKHENSSGNVFADLGFPH